MYFKTFLFDMNFETFLSDSYIT